MYYLVIGGTSGLGLEFAKLFKEKEHAKVIVTGRHDPEAEGIEFREFDLSAKDVSKRVELFVKSLPKIDVVVYAAGFYQEGRVTDLSESQIEEMLNVGGRGLIYFAKALLHKQGSLDTLITITSTSQWTPRKLEPIYNFVKAGAGHLTNALAEDGRIKKVMVVGPAGMKSGFWRDIEREDLETMNDPADVAAITMVYMDEEFRYKFIRILRDPLRVEVVETR